MVARRRRVVKWLLMFLLVLGLVGYLARDALFFAFLYNGSRADWEVMQLHRQVEYDLFQGKKKGPDDSVRERYIEIGNANPGTRAEVTSCLSIVKHWSDSNEADVAFEKLLEAAKNADIGDWERSLQETRPGRRDHELLGPERWRPLAVPLIERVRHQPDHPKSARLLCEVANTLHPGSNAVSATDELLQVANLIQQRYSSSPGIANFCEVAGNLGSPVSWSQPFEPHVRDILEANEDRFVRLSAHFALASIVRSHVSRQKEARQLYEEFLADFDGKTPHSAQSIEHHTREEARQILKIMDAHGIGMSAPETDGVDLDGNALSLKDYRGKVVLVSFWATWCGPCLDAIPHELALLEEFGQSDFAIFGVNVDKDIGKAKAVVQKHSVTWRSLQSPQGGTLNVKNWTIPGYPAFYLLDKRGVIAQSWTGLPPESELSVLIRELIDMEIEK